jgi:hypothetical protein
VFGADAVAEQFGVVKSSYDAVPTLPLAGGGGAAADGGIRGGGGSVAAVVCRGAGPVSRVLELESQVTCVREGGECVRACVFGGGACVWVRGGMCGGGGGRLGVGWGGGG